ncbi:hypothetical protein Goshw_023278 [Gossypium schwendimanii]|uniref:Uncharacterized protein n=1 Tax=Gossypium schwendimanii TaxID=34291 RepID=A0A7J9L531_GOSSC|nr:hypothetical protein [Gossypium schwendimanii]
MSGKFLLLCETILTQCLRLQENMERTLPGGRGPSSCYSVVPPGVLELIYKEANDHMALMKEAKAWNFQGYCKCLLIWAKNLIGGFRCSVKPASRSALASKNHEARALAQDSRFRLITLNGRAWNTHAWTLPRGPNHHPATSLPPLGSQARVN